MRGCAEMVIHDARRLASTPQTGRRGIDSEPRDKSNQRMVLVRDPLAGRRGMIQDQVRDARSRGLVSPVQAACGIHPCADLARRACTSNVLP